MPIRAKLLLTGVLLVGIHLAANAFSLLGPFTTWQIPALNYLSPFTSIQREGDLGGPMNLQEEYRWGSPVLIYGFDSSFVGYFGPEGVAAVEEAIQTLNDLPYTSDMDLTTFPLDTTRFNLTAQQLRMLDVKSITLSIMLQNLGLACPERYAWTLYQQRPIPGTDPQQYLYSTIQRNFDPFTWKPSAYVNNTLYTYLINQIGANPDTWDCQELRVDVANPNVSVIATAGLQAGVTDPLVQQEVYGSGVLLGSYGLFYTGLTRDDAGAIKYMYRTGNTNWQTAPIGSTGSSSSSPWNIVGFEILNPNPGSPWTVVGGGLFGQTNVPGGGIITGNFLVDGGRGASGKISLVRVDTDPLLGEYLVPVTVRYPETVINASGIRVNQVTQRVITTPDVLFVAGDIGAYPDFPQPYVYSVLGFANTYVQNPSNPIVQDGPGIVEPGIFVTFNKVGPWIFNVSNTGQPNGVLGWVWGSYNGTTNAPVAYPLGTSLQELETILYP